ncbi:hypothetical protein GPK34_06245 [Secundilactobacillus kimchicus]|uniref:hypothetical protein n=1 Tax=Secundilactobacillus kimchicus TaxID=528209 RepID=UPI001C03432F|nr:hypothetical protein [Secundilactobacillus kimchicus]MBT9671627.1 hypothetical protein [Secundilactobacillus kimchicus]
MLDVKGSIDNLSTTVTRHFAHIKNQHEFIRAWAVQFELAYTDFRVIEMALQLSGDAQHPLLAEFAAAYDAVYKYEYAFAGGGLEGFNQQFGNQIDDYEKAKDHLLEVIEKVKAVD